LVLAYAVCWFYLLVAWLLGCLFALTALCRAVVVVVAVLAVLLLLLQAVVQRGPWMAL